MSLTFSDAGRTSDINLTCEWASFRVGLDIITGTESEHAFSVPCVYLLSTLIHAPLIFHNQEKNPLKILQRDGNVFEISTL
jgi:hypothetical protein